MQCFVDLVLERDPGRESGGVELLPLFARLDELHSASALQFALVQAVKSQWGWCLLAGEEEERV